MGLGGVTAPNGNFELLQDGTYYNATGAPQAFWEYIGHTGGTPGTDTGVGEQLFPGGLSISPGDKIYAETTINLNSGIANFFVTDETTGVTASADFGSGYFYYDGSTADWVTERPQNTSTKAYYPLQNFGSDTWTAAQATNSNGTVSWLSNTHAQYYFNMKYNSDTLATTDSTIKGANGASFSSTFDSCL